MSEIFHAMSANLDCSSYASDASSAAIRFKAVTFGAAGLPGVQYIEYGPGRGTITVRLHGHDEGRQRRFNHAENVRPVAPVDPDFGRLSRIPNAAGSIGDEIAGPTTSRRRGTDRTTCVPS
jgi:hypothetical protein